MQSEKHGESREGAGAGRRRRETEGTPRLRGTRPLGVAPGPSPLWEGRSVRWGWREGRLRRAWGQDSERTEGLSMGPKTGALQDLSQVGQGGRQPGLCRLVPTALSEQQHLRRMDFPALRQVGSRWAGLAFYR